MKTKTTIRCCAAALICCAAAVGHADGEKNIAELKAEIAALKDKLAEQRALALNFEAMYYDEHGKIEDLKDELEAMKSKYVPTEKLREQVAFYQTACATNSYILAQSTNVFTTTILCYGGGNENCDGSHNDADTNFYKRARLVSKVDFEPLRLYRVTDGKETRWLVYTPPKETMIVGGIPYPVIEAHGGDWVELDIRGPRDDDKHIEVYGYQDMDGNMHVGTKVPRDTLTHFVIATFGESEDE